MTGARAIKYTQAQYQTYDSMNPQGTQCMGWLQDDQKSTLADEIHTMNTGALTQPHTHTHTLYAFPTTQPNTFKFLTFTSYPTCKDTHYSFWMLGALRSRCFPSTKSAPDSHGDNCFADTQMTPFWQRLIFFFFKKTTSFVYKDCILSVWKSDTE